MHSRIGKTKILKNLIPESEPTPLGFYCYALTNKKHSRTRSVRLIFCHPEAKPGILAKRSALLAKPKEVLYNRRP